MQQQKSDRLTADCCFSLVWISCYHSHHRQNLITSFTASHERSIRPDRHRLLYRELTMFGPAAVPASDTGTSQWRTGFNTEWLQMRYLVEVVALQHVSLKSSSVFLSITLISFAPYPSPSPQEAWDSPDQAARGFISDGTLCCSPS
jgi:hypothetical protein